MLKYDSKNKILAKNLRKNMTPWERKLWYLFLKDYKIRFNRQKPIGQYIADFYSNKLRLVIELDGGGHYTDSQIVYDKERTSYFKSLGLEEIRIINTDIDTKFNEVCNYIDYVVNKKLKV